MGPHINDEEPIASRTPALEIFIFSTVLPNSCAISGAAGNRHVLEYVTARVIQLTTNRIIPLRQLGSSVRASGTATAGAASVSFCPIMANKGRWTMEVTKEYCRIVYYYISEMDKWFYLR